MKKIIANILNKLGLSQKANLFIIGAQKCGTSTLFDNLVQHHNIYGGIIKEKNFFSHLKVFQKGYTWYHQLFSTKRIYLPFGKNYFIDASPSYLNNKEAADRIYQYNPNAKFIVMMRNPIDRAFSAWNMYQQMNELNIKDKNELIVSIVDRIGNHEENPIIDLIKADTFPSFEELVEKELKEISSGEFLNYKGVVTRGLYISQIEHYLTLFNIDQFYFICSEEFKTNKNLILADLVDFLKLKQNLLMEDLQDGHVRVYKSKISPELRMKLLKFYEPYNQKLFKLINKTYPWNN